MEAIFDKCSTSRKNGFLLCFEGGGAKNVKTLIFSASRALIKNRLDESSNLAHRGMHAKFQLIWTGSLVRAMGRVEN